VAAVAGFAITYVATPGSSQQRVIYGAFVAIGCWFLTWLALTVLTAVLQVRRNAKRQAERVNS
jgi:hypothetical protein